jgi:GrpB-like predicted nucleotidyltransferase (UPF0157 family)
MADVNAARVQSGILVPTPVEVVVADPAWPQWYAAVHDRISAALGERVLAIEHVGSTSVPELSAKPVIDVDLTVADSADEAAWLPDLEAAGFILTVREPDWEEHRLLRGHEPPTHLHVFSPTAREAQRHRMFRDWLRTHPADRDRYAEVKRAVAARGVTDPMLYNQEKARFIYDLYEKVLTGDPEHEHDPHPVPAARPTSPDDAAPAPTSGDDRTNPPHWSRRREGSSRSHPNT